MPADLSQNPPFTSGKSTPKEPETGRFFAVEYVKKTRFGYKAGYNYTNFCNVTANVYVSKQWTEADLMLFYELKGTGIDFNRIQIGRMICYSIKKIQNNYLKQICYEFNK